VPVQRGKGGSSGRATPKGYLVPWEIVEDQAFDLGRVTRACHEDATACRIPAEDFGPLPTHTGAKTYARGARVREQTTAPQSASVDRLNRRSSNSLLPLRGASRWSLMKVKLASRA